jgi:hypothetical protein
VDLERKLRQHGNDVDAAADALLNAPPPHTPLQPAPPPVPPVPPPPPPPPPPPIFAQQQTPRLVAVFHAQVRNDRDTAVI